MKSPKKAVKKNSAVAKLAKAAGGAKVIPDSNTWNLRLYVAGQTPKSLTAFANLKQLCELHLAGRYEIEIIDLTKQPERAQHDQIVALPTLIRKLPEPIKRVIGDLSNLEQVMMRMDLSATAPTNL